MVLPTFDSFIFIINTAIWGWELCFSILLLSQVLLSDERLSLLYFPACVLLYILVQAEGLPFICDVALCKPGYGLAR